MDARDTNLLALALGVLANAFVHRGPALVHPCLVLLRDESKRGVVEDDQGSTIDFFQPVLDVGKERVGGSHRSYEFQQRGPLDGLDVGPEVAIAVAEVAVPPAS